VARKISGVFYLNREESIQYLIKAYDLKWCFSRWQNGKVKISYETNNSLRGYSLLLPYKIKGFRTIMLSKCEIDLAMLGGTKN